MAALKKLKILPFALFQGWLTTLLGLLCGIIYSFGGLLIDAGVSLGWLSGSYWGTPGLSYGTVLAFGALIGMPLIFGVIGVAGGIVEAVLYNWISPWIGGFKWDFS